MAQFSKNGGAPALGLRVLVVEDDAMLSMMLEDALETLGCTVHTATTVREGVRLAATAEAQIGLLDVNVAGQAVYPVAEVLRQRGIPFVFVTAYVHADVAQEYGRVPRLHKPFHLADLEGLLRRMSGGAAIAGPAGR